MSDYMTKPLDELAADIIADGVVDAQEVAQIRERLYADGVIDREEADFLFKVNDAVSGADNDPGWQTLFAEAITGHVLDDEESPGVVDEDEAQWLISRIEGDETVDGVEKALLQTIKDKATSLHDTLKFKMEMWKI